MEYNEVLEAGVLMANAKDETRSWRLGVVCYLNAKPLIDGLDRDPALHMVYDVPSKLAPMLDAGQVDAALVPVIDLARNGRRWQIVSDACIGCDGETLTVRVFSRVPAEAIRRLHVDGDSHTSVVLATLLWKELYGRDLEVVKFTGNETLDECEAVLLIGDKVVHHTLLDYHIETDLGSAWKTLTSLPFVFAVWAAPVGMDVSELSRRLTAARDRGERSAELIAEDFGPGLNWPVALAKRYLTKRLKFRMGPRHKLAIRRFFELAGRHSLIEPVDELVFA